MALIEDLSNLLPIEYPFELKEVDKDDINLRVTILLSVSEGALPSNCRIHSYYEREWEHLKIFQYRSFIKCKIPIYQDRATGKLTKPTISFSRDYSKFTLLYEAEVMRLMHIHNCFSSVATQLGIYPQRVESLYHYYTQHLEIDELSHTPENIAFDETSTCKGHDYITTFWDLDKQCIVGIYDGKSSESVKEFQQNHPYPEAVKNISMDMSPAFISGVTTYLPQADITFDKWHVIKLLHKHLDNLTNQADDFKALINMLMNQLGDFYKQQNYEQFSAQLAFIADFAQEKLQNNPISKTIRNHFEGIANYANSQLNNGILEGINSKIQTIKRIARGFRSKHTFKKMIRFAFQSHSVQVIS
jgi:transposase